MDVSTTPNSATLDMHEMYRDFAENWAALAVIAGEELCPPTSCTTAGGSRMWLRFLRVTPRCLPFELQADSERSIVCGAEASADALFGQSY